MCACAIAAPALTSVEGAALKAAHVSRVIQDVKLLAPSAAPRPAAIDDPVKEGTAVRTGIQSRAELTFADLTITRLGENTVFNFGANARELDLATGSVLVQVPSKAPPARITTAAVTAAISGGTAMFATGPPIKFMVLEGTGTFYPKGHPEEAITLHGGEMMMFTPDGHMVGPMTFDVKKVMETSHLIIDFPDLPNLPLILDVMNGQTSISIAGPSPAPQKDIVDLVDQTNNASSSPPPGPPPSGTPGKFGPPSTIGSPVPYVITSGTQIQTDPVITTNGVTNYGTIYQGSGIDGPFSAWAFGSTSSFDTTSGFDGQITHSGAVFKFASLSLAGDPMIDTTSGETGLGLIGVNSVISGSGGMLTFPGIEGLLIATEAGSINLGSGISFNGPTDLNFYARGSTSDLTLGSDATSSGNIRLYAGRDIQVNSAISTPTFTAFSGGDFFANASGTNIMADNIDVESLSNITIDASKVPDPVSVGGAIIFNAADTVNLALYGGGNFGWDSLNIQGTTVNLTNPAPTTFNFSNSSSVTVTAGTGGINASNIEFFGDNLTLDSTANIDIYSATTPLDMNNNPAISGSITANGNIDAAGEIDTGILHADGNITGGGALKAGDISANGNIMADSDIFAYGGSITADGDIISTSGSIELQQNPPGTFGNITAGGDISAAGGIFTPGDPVIVMADGSITAPGVITGTLQAGTDITIDNSGGGFGFGIVANHVSAGGTLYLINSPTISPNNGGSGGNDGETLDDFSMTVGSISSTGPTFAVLSSNGGDADSNFVDSNPGNGGNITLMITAGGLNVGEPLTYGVISLTDLESIQANGGAYNASGPFGGGNGGTINITAAGDVTIDSTQDGSPTIFASSGIVSDDTTQFAGNGGTVNITSTGGAVAVEGSIEVSSEDSAHRPEDPFGRESASGGTIDLQSNLTTGIGITVGANGSLLSYLSLDALNADGAPGSITLSTMGADIVVNGTVRADFGTITIDQDDPVAATPTITLDGATLQGARLNINGSGDLTIGPNYSTAINVYSDSTWNVSHDITINAANTSFAYAFTLNATAGNAINFTGGSSGSPATLTLPLSGDTTFQAGTGGINAQYVDIQFAGAALNLVSGGDITANSIAFTDYYARGSVNAVGALTVTNDLNSGDVSAASIDAGGDSLTGSLTSSSTINIGGRMGSFGTVTANGAITAGTVAVPTIVDPNGVLTVGSGGIKPFVFSTDPSFPAQGAKAPHVFTVDSIVSPNGIDLSGNQFGGIDGYSSGGILTLNVNSATFDPSSGIGIVNFNGADAGATDFSGNVFTTVGGDGGTFIANAAGDITVTSDSPITATTGEIDPNLSNATDSGAGGTVELNSTNGTVSVDSSIQVSSAEPTSTVAPFRSSSSGGNISLTSGKTSGVAINLTSSAQLLALLSNTAALSSGGNITIVATNAANNGTSTSSIDIDNTYGQIRADRGTVEIRHDGDGGLINLTNSNISADIVKIGALGNDGTLTIGGGTISADSMLKLYAGSSNGSIDFVSDVTLNSSSTAAIIAANTVTIENGVTVTIVGLAAMVYTNNANYAPLDALGNPEGGTNLTSTGRFGGSGAITNSLPAPLFDDPPGNLPITRTASAPANAQNVSSAKVTSSGVRGGAGGTGRLQPEGPIRRSGRSGDLVATNAKSAGTAINVANSGQLLSMLDEAAPGPGGKITIAPSKSTRNGGNSARSGVSRRVTADGNAADARRMRDRRVIQPTTNTFSGAGDNNARRLASAPGLH